jgi:hypothetical protein
MIVNTLSGDPGCTFPERYPVTSVLPKGLRGFKVLLPVLGIGGVVCAFRTRLVTNSL